MDDAEARGEQQKLESLPTLPPLPPLSSSTTVSKTRPVGTVHPFIHNTIDPSSLTLKTLPPPLQSNTKPGLESPVDHSPLPTTSHDNSCQPTSQTTTPTHLMEETLLPPDKKWHVFVSHSTSDQRTVRESIVVPLREKGRKVTACYHYMPDNTRYDDKAIHKAIGESCTVLICISNAYINSPRCIKEMDAALSLHSGAKSIIVIALSMCSRPHPIKTFLYLDFIDQSKQANVWKKLQEQIDHCVVKLNQHIRPPSPPVISASSPASSDKSDSIISDYAHDNYLDRNYDEVVQAMEKGDMRQLFNFPSGDEGVRGGDSESGLSDGESADDRNVVKEGVSEGVVDVSEIPSLHGKKRKRNDSDIEDGEVSSSDSDELQATSKKPNMNEDGPSLSENENQTEVQKFYDKLAEPGVDNRQESPILYMRGFNNWLKSVLIRTYLPHSATVLDLCCGKGGDLNKWKEGRIVYLVGADISETSIEHCKGRYTGNKMLDRRTWKPVFDAEFITADCCQVRLQEMYTNPGRRFHVTSCQFSLHYAFESHERAAMMLQNACENLRPEGYFIGTTVDSNELVRRLREDGTQDDNGCWTIGNDVYRVTLSQEFDPHGKLPLFGCKYHFHLSGVVNVPEYLVYFPLLAEMLKEWDMVEICHQNFYEFFAEHRHIPEDAHLLYKMQAFDKDTGTMSSAEWEAIGLYLVFVFQKRLPHPL